MVLDVVLQGRRNQAAAEVLLHRLVEGQPTGPQVLVTDNLAGYTPALKKVFPRAAHRRHKGFNNPLVTINGPETHTSKLLSSCAMIVPAEGLHGTLAGADHGLCCQSEHVGVPSPNRRFF